jgi:hypothetical protein
MTGYRSRKKTKRERMRVAVKTELIPYLAEFGFERIQKPLAGGPDLIEGWRNNYARKRGEFSDEIHIEWRRYRRPYFMIEFWTDQTELMTPYYTPPSERLYRTEDPPVLHFREFYARIYPTPPHWWDGPDVWYGKRMSVEKTIRIAKQRIADLDHYLRMGFTNASLGAASIPAVWGDRPPDVFFDIPPPEPPRSFWYLLFFGAPRTKTPWPRRRP